MRFSLRSFRGSAAALVTAAAFLASPATAQDCQLQIQAMKNVLWPGQSTDVQVFARFTPSMYAFASAQFRVLADIPAWTFASAGAIAGSDVVNIDVSQAHQPFLGVFADPSNPLRIWHGTFQPTSWVPRLVRIETSPLGVSVYPSKLTSSSVPCTPQRDVDWIAVNPMAVGRARVAPSEGTTIVRTGPETIRASSAQGPIRVGLLLPAVNGAREAARTRIQSATPLEQLVHTLVPERTASPHAVTVLAWARSTYDPNSGLRVSNATASGYRFVFFHQGGPVGAVDRTGDALPCPLAELPDRIGGGAGDDVLVGGQTSYGYGEFDRPQTLSIPGRAPIVCDRIEAHALQNDRRPLAIGMQVIESSHSGVVQFAFMDGSVR